MNNNLRLDSKQRRRIKYCPCGKSNRDGKFVPFKGSEKYGFCHSCDKWYNDQSGVITDNVAPTPDKPTFYHEKGLIKKTVKKSGNNNFIHFLRKNFDQEFVEKAIKEYFIGTSKHWDGATIFWQVDQEMKVRHGKLMLYDKETGKRNQTYNNNVRTVLGLRDDAHELRQCLFGLHLSTVYDKRKIAIVESEKTAIIMSMVYPEYLFMATGGKGNFKYDMLKPIKAYNIVAFPDKDAIDTWSNEADKLNKYGFKITVDKTLLKFDVPKNTDVADVFLNHAPTPKKNPERTLSTDDLAANKLNAKNPLFEKLVSEFDLVHNNGMEIMIE
ncbi:hypothetical protein GGE08_000364 [Muricauda sp. ARW1Y1]|nr:hypothetical protein [Muricauda sp. ARW1Y1]